MVADRAICGFSGACRWLSNFAPVQVQLDYEYYPSVEHAYQAAKTPDPYKRRAMACVHDPKIVKRLGSDIKVGAGWHARKLDVMLDLLIQKFAQEPYKSQLEATHDWHLIEANHWGDTFWGICNGVGENHLGRLIEQVRDRNRAQPL